MQSLAQPSGGAVPAGTAYPAEPLSSTYPQPAADLSSSTSDEPLDLLESKGAPVSQARVRNLSQREIAEVDAKVRAMAHTFGRSGVCIDLVLRHELNYQGVAQRMTKVALHHVIGVRPESIETRLFKLFFHTCVRELATCAIEEVQR